MPREPDAAGRAVLVYAARDDHVGIARHVDRKVALLEACGLQVEPINVAGRGVRELIVGSTARRIAARSRHGLVYARLGRTTLILMTLLAMRRHQLVLEINGFVHLHLHPRLRGGARWALRRLGKARRVTIVGDGSWEPYVRREMGPGVRFVELPLTPGQERIPPAPPKRSIVFGGSLVESQGLISLVEAWRRLPRECRAEWSLQVFGAGPLRQRLESEFGLEVGEPVSGADYQATLARAGVLVAPFPNSMVPGDPLSSLKTLDYATTDRPMVTTTLDVVLSHYADPEAELIFAWDGQTIDGLTAALSRAIEEWDSPAAATRWEALSAARGPEVQVAQMKRALGTLHAEQEAEQDL